MLERGADRRSMTQVYEAAGLGNAVELRKLLAKDKTDIDTPGVFYNATPLWMTGLLQSRFTGSDKN